MALLGPYQGLNQVLSRAYECLGKEGVEQGDGERRKGVHGGHG